MLLLIPLTEIGERSVLDFRREVNHEKVPLDIQKHLGITKGIISFGCQRANRIVADKLRVSLP